MTNQNATQESDEAKLLRWLLISQTSQTEVLEAFRNVHEASGYKAYNPFPGGTGTPGGVKSLVRAFVAPKEKGWVRIFGHMDVELLPHLAEGLKSMIIHVWLTMRSAHIEAIGPGALDAHLRDGSTQAGLLAALKQLDQFDQSASTTLEAGEAAHLADLIDQSGVNPKDAEKLVARTTNRLLKKMGGQGEAAHDLLARQSQSPLATAHGANLRAVIACLTVPENWYDPTFSDLSAAYPIALILEKDEDAPLLPGDEDLLDKVEFPLDYEPAYYAR